MGPQTSSSTYTYALQAEKTARVSAATTIFNSISSASSTVTNSITTIQSALSSAISSLNDLNSLSTSPAFSIGMIFDFGAKKGD